MWPSCISYCNLLRLEQHRHKRPAVNRFLDVEAEVDEDEDEEEDEDEYARGTFHAFGL